jgi:hypothetical protein
VDSLTTKFPQEAAKFKGHLAALKTLEARKYAAIRQAERAMVEFDATTEKVAAIWEVTALARAASKSAGQSAEAEAMRKIQEDETVKAADDAMALSFAELTAAIQLSPDYEAPLKNMGAIEEVVQSLPAPAPQAGYPFTLEPHPGAKLRVVNSSKDHS